MVNPGGGAITLGGEAGKLVPQLEMRQYRRWIVTPPPQTKQKLEFLSLAEGMRTA
jgi:hypothetical protein